MLTEPISSTKTQDPTAKTVELLENSHALSGLSEPWNKLAGGDVFCRFEWLAYWWQCFQQPRDRLFVIVIRQGANVVGVAPLFVDQGAVGQRRVRFLGQGRVCSEYLKLLSDPRRAEEVASDVANFLRQRSDEFDRIELDAMAADDPATGHWHKALIDNGFALHPRPGLPCWRISLPATWDEYLSMLSKHRRWRVRKLWREQYEPGHASVFVPQTGDELNDALPALISLHQQRRTSLGERGCFAEDDFTEFLTQSAHALFASNRLRLQCVRHHGQPIAAEFDLVGDDALYHYQSGFDPAAEELRPGWLGVTAAVRHAIEHGHRYFDFLRGDEAYKASWRAEPVPMLQINAFPPHQRGRACRMIHVVCQAVRTVRRSILTRSRSRT